MRNSRLPLALAALWLLILALAGVACSTPAQPQAPAAVFPVKTAEARLVLPAGGSVSIPLPTTTAPTEPAPIVTIAGVIVDDVNGQRVAASVQVVDHLGVEHVVRQVNQFQVTMPAGGVVAITVTAPGYQRWSVRVKPHVRHSAALHLPVRLTPTAAEPVEPGAGQSDQPGVRVPPATSVDM